jgi:hypothetical protein
LIKSHLPSRKIPLSAGQTLYPEKTLHGQKIQARRPKTSKKDSKSAPGMKPERFLECGGLSAIIIDSAEQKKAFRNTIPMDKKSKPTKDLDIYIIVL